MKCILLISAVIAVSVPPSAGQKIAAGEGMSVILRDKILWRMYKAVAEPIAAGRDWASVAAIHGVDESGALWDWSFHMARVGTDADWRQVASWSGTRLGIKTDGSLWSWGIEKLPVRIGSATGWTDVSAGGSRYVARQADGSLWAWGFGRYHAAGDGTSETRSEPVRIGAGTDWTGISAGGSFSYALKSDGSLWGWGIGALGNGTNQFPSSPTRVGGDSDWAFIHAGNESSYAIKRDGSLWSWGKNANGQLGVGDKIERPVPTRIGTESDWTAVASGTSHVLATRADGSVWGWGLSNNYQLGFAGADVLEPMKLDHLLIPLPVIGVFAGGPIPSPYGNLNVGAAILGEPRSFTFEIRNAGAAPLVITAVSPAAGFSVVSVPSEIPGLTSKAAVLRIDATTAGPVSGKVRISSNDPDTPEFSFTLSSDVLSPANDTDGDGFNDAAELALESFGLNWKFPNSATTLRAGAAAAGLYHPMEIFQVEGAARIEGGALKFELRDATGARVPMSSAGATAGGLRFSVKVPYDRQFFRVR